MTTGQGSAGGLTARSVRKECELNNVGGEKALRTREKELLQALHSSTGEDVSQAIPEA